MTLFLVIAGLTGSLLVWYPVLDRASWPALRAVDPPHANAQAIPPLALRERVLREIPGATANYYELSTEAGMPVAFNVDSPTDDELWVDPYTGQELGRRKWGAISQGWKNVMPFIY